MQEKGWAQVAEVINKHGALPIMQLMHAGALPQHLSNTRSTSQIRPLRSMLVGYSKTQGQYSLPHAMNLSEILDVKKWYFKAAVRACSAGFQGVEIHAANGYLLDQFLTEYTNTREDSYGGNLLNRIRLTSEIINEIKSKMWADFIVGVRLSQGKGGYSKS